MFNAIWRSGACLPVIYRTFRTARVLYGNWRHFEVHANDLHPMFGWFVPETSGVNIDIKKLLSDCELICDKS